MKDTIEINLRALSEEDREKLEKILLDNCVLVGDETNGEALLVLRQFTEE